MEKKNIIPESLDKAVEKFLVPGASAMGTSFKHIWNLVFGYRLQEKADKYEIEMQARIDHFQKKIEREYLKIPESQRINPSLHITGQALYKSQFAVEEDEIRDMFAKLIAGSMDSQYRDSIHPSFAEMVNQLSVSDANILKMIYQQGSAIGYINLHVRLKDGFGKTLEKYLTCLDGFENQVVCMSIENLCRLSVLEPIDGQVSEEEYEDIENMGYYIELKNRVTEFTRNDFAVVEERKCLNFTDYGESFCNVVLGERILDHYPHMPGSL